jgi:hypothetical protein
LFRADVGGAPFLSGVDRGFWRLISIDWPNAIIEIAAAPRPGTPEWLALRFDLTHYPEAPSAQPWDVAASAPLPPARWPGGSERILRIFNPSWRNDALYFPMDRLALSGHLGRDKGHHAVPAGHPRAAQQRGVHRCARMT